MPHMMGDNPRRLDDPAYGDMAAQMLQLAGGARPGAPTIRRRDPGVPPYQGLNRPPVIAPNSYPPSPRQQLPGVVPAQRSAWSPLETMPRA